MIKGAGEPTRAEVERSNPGIDAAFAGLGEAFDRLRESVTQSFQLFSAPAPHVEMHTELLGLFRLKSGWDGHEAVPPTPSCVLLALRVLDTALALHLPPSKCVPDVDGGIALYWLSRDTIDGGAHTRLASISISNDGELARTQHDRLTNRFTAEDMGLHEISHMIPTLSRFVRDDGAQR